MVTKERYHLRWDVYDALAVVERFVKDGADGRVRCVFNYSTYDLQIRRNKKKCYCTFNHF